MQNRENRTDVPSVFVSADTLPEAWEKAVLAVCREGVEIKTEYDAEKDPPSLDATVMVEVRKPLEEPRVHKNFPGGPVELETYRQEVVEGIHDHWINPLEGKWTYTYHQRLFAYLPPFAEDSGSRGKGVQPVDQIRKMTEKLAETTYTRRAQAITWIPHQDPDTDDPPCLQRLWGRLLPGGGDRLVLNLNAHWRSRDLYKAWFMNVFALTDLQKVLAKAIEEKTGRTVDCGRYVDISDSLHIYGSYRTEDFEEEVSKMETSPYSDRAWDSSMLEPMFQEARENLRKDPDYYSKGDA